MENKQKQELKTIVKEIPQIRVDSFRIKTLWRIYANHFTYGTFRKYLMTFRNKGGSQ